MVKSFHEGDRFQTLRNLLGFGIRGNDRKHLRGVTHQNHDFDTEGLVGSHDLSQRHVNQT